MIKSEKKFKELAHIFEKKNSLQISGAIISLRNEEPFEGVIGLLIALFDTSKDRSVRKTIENFLNDLKDPSVRPEVIEEIRKTWQPETISMLAASCWQSGLDYSDYLDVIADIFLKYDYATSIECMTVIEGSAAGCSREMKDEIIKVILDSPLSGVNEKSALTLELISILEK